MSQLRLVVSQKSNPSSPLSGLDSVKCKMLRADSTRLPSLAKKAARLQALRPVAADLLEKLVDDLLAEVSLVLLLLAEVS